MRGLMLGCENGRVATLQDRLGVQDALPGPKIFNPG